MHIAKALVLAGLGVTAVALTGCEKELKAPVADDICYFIGHPPGAKEPKFNPVARNVPSIEKCAVELFTVRTNMRVTGTAGPVTEGAYNGSFLFVNNTTVEMAPKYEGIRMTLLVKAGNKLVQPGAIVVEEPRGNEPHTVEVPKDLPQKNAEGKVVTPGQ